MRVDFHSHLSSGQEVSVTAFITTDTHTGAWAQERSRYVSSLQIYSMGGARIIPLKLDEDNLSEEALDQ